jgi:hypothetical protein
MRIVPPVRIYRHLRLAEAWSCRQIQVLAAVEQNASPITL